MRKYTSQDANNFNCFIVCRWKRDNKYDKSIIVHTPHEEFVCIELTSYNLIDYLNGKLPFKFNIGFKNRNHIIENMLISGGKVFVINTIKELAEFI